MLKHFVVIAFGLSSTAGWSASPEISSFEANHALLKPVESTLPNDLGWLRNVTNALVRHIDDDGQHRFDVKLSVKDSPFWSIDIGTLTLDPPAQGEPAEERATVIASATSETEDGKTTWSYQMELDGANFDEDGTFLGFTEQQAPVLFKIIPSQAAKPKTRKSRFPSVRKGIKKLRGMSKPKPAAEAGPIEYVLQFQKPAESGDEGGLPGAAAAAAPESPVTAKLEEVIGKGSKVPQAPDPEVDEEPGLKQAQHDETRKEPGQIPGEEPGLKPGEADSQQEQDQDKEPSQIPVQPELVLLYGTEQQPGQIPGEPEPQQENEQGQEPDQIPGEGPDQKPAQHGETQQEPDQRPGEPGQEPGQIPGEGPDQKPAQHDETRQEPDQKQGEEPGQIPVQDDETQQEPDPKVDEEPAPTQPEPDQKPEPGEPEPEQEPEPDQKPEESEPAPKAPRSMKPTEKAPLEAEE